MCERLQEKYYLIKFQVLQEEYFTFWYTDDVDGFLLDMDGALKSFPTKEEAVAFADKKGFLLDADVFLVSSVILRKMNIRDINCHLFLDYWNIFSDVAHSINCPFIGDRRHGIVQHIYEKLFYGCNILVKENEEHYRPKWSRKERRWIARVMKNGFQVLEEGFDVKWHL